MTHRRFMTSRPFVRGPSAEVKQVLEESRIVIELLDAVNLSMTVPQRDRTEIDGHDRVFASSLKSFL